MTETKKYKWVNEKSGGFSEAEDIAQRNHINLHDKDAGWSEKKKHAMSPKFAHITKVHPCYNEKLHDKVGRVHVPIAPKCNIGCNFCIRSINGDENRPGVAGEILSADEAVAHVENVTSEDLPISVVGVAGPGDSLANDATFEFFEKITEEKPEMIKCMSTNGLLLPKYAERIAELGVDTLTVTVNAVDPEIGKDIYGFVIYEGEVYKGREGAEILLRNQLEGIKKVTDLGVVVKVNTVLIPGVNDQHIEEIALEPPEDIMLKLVEQLIRTFESPCLRHIRMEHLRREILGPCILRPCFEPGILEALIGEMRGKHFLLIRALGIGDGFLCFPQVFQIDIAVLIQHFEAMELYLRSFWPSDLELHPARHILAKVQYPLALGGGEESLYR